MAKTFRFLWGALLPFFLSLSLVSHHGQASTVSAISGSTMGTTYSVKYWLAGEKPDEGSWKEDVDALLRDVNQQMSTYIKTSDISQFNRLPAGKGKVVGLEFATVVQHALSLAKDTDGIFDPTVGPLVNLWGFGPAGRPEKTPSQLEVAEALKLVGYKKVSLDRTTRTLSKTVSGVYLDLSSVAKGFGVDAIHNLLWDKGVRNMLVEIGGELRASGAKPGGEAWTVGIERPGVGRVVQRVLPLRNLSIATSGNYRNFYRDAKGQSFVHTINPKTGKGAKHRLASVTVLADSCMEADGLATALMAMGPELAWKYAKERKVQAVFIEADGAGKFSVRETPAFAKRRKS